MKVIIEIECDTMKDVFLHLGNIKSGIKKQLGPFDPQNEVPRTIEVNDANCYGEHVAIFYPEEVSGVDMPNIKRTFI